MEMAHVCPIAPRQVWIAACTAPATIREGLPFVSATLGTLALRATHATWGTRTTTGTVHACLIAPVRASTAASTENATTQEERLFAPATWGTPALSAMPALWVSRTTTGTVHAYPTALLKTAAGKAPAMIQPERPSASATRDMQELRANHVMLATRTTTGTANACLTAPRRDLTAVSTGLATTRAVRPFAHATLGTAELRATPATRATRTTMVTANACPTAPHRALIAVHSAPAMIQEEQRFASATKGTMELIVTLVLQSTRISGQVVNCSGSLFLEGHS